MIGGWPCGGGPSQGAAGMRFVLAKVQPLLPRCRSWWLCLGRDRRGSALRSLPRGCVITEQQDLGQGGAAGPRWLPPSTCWAGRAERGGRRVLAARLHSCMWGPQQERGSLRGWGSGLGSCLRESTGGR